MNTKPTVADLAQAIAQLSIRGYNHALDYLSDEFINVKKATEEQLRAALLHAGCSENEIDDLDFRNAK